jgi:hypothetical protein
MDGFGAGRIDMEHDIDVLRGKVDISALLTERGETHGPFADNAFYSQRLRELFRSDEDNWNSISDRKREALEMIAGKISRILSGAPDFPDHWEDIAGYATLAVETE